MCFFVQEELQLMFLLNPVSFLLLLLASRFTRLRAQPHARSLRDRLRGTATERSFYGHLGHGR